MANRIFSFGHKTLQLMWQNFSSIDSIRLYKMMLGVIVGSIVIKFEIDMSIVIPAICGPEQIAREVVAESISPIRRPVPTWPFSNVNDCFSQFSPASIGTMFLLRLPS